jgi:hypothetical protein
MRRAGFLATLAAGVGLLGTSLYGIGGVDRTLQIAAAPKPSPELVREYKPRHDCPDRDRTLPGRHV